MISKEKKIDRKVNVIMKKKKNVEFIELSQIASILINEGLRGLINGINLNREFILGI